MANELKEALEDLVGTMWCSTDDVYFITGGEVTEPFYNHWGDIEGHLVEIRATNVFGTEGTYLHFEIPIALVWPVSQYLAELLERSKWRRLSP